MKHKLILILAVVLLVLVFSSLVLIIITIKYSGIHEATGYEDAGGWVYHCSQPVKIKEQGAMYMSGKPSPTPVNPSEAIKYCHKEGIE